MLSVSNCPLQLSAIQHLYGEKKPIQINEKNTSESLTSRQFLCFPYPC